MSGREDTDEAHFVINIKCDDKSNNAKRSVLSYDQANLERALISMVSLVSEVACTGKVRRVTLDFYDKQ